LNTMKSCLMDTKRPIIFGFTVFKSMETPEVDKTGAIPMPTPYDKRLGGHDVLIVGWDDNTQRFILKNSWSPQWGTHGYGSIPYAYAVNPQLAGDFWVVVKASGVKPPPVDPMPPTPPGPNPTPPPNIDKDTVIARIEEALQKLNQMETTLEWLLAKLKAT
jgi:hypothetical protein